ncbi:MAG: 4-diphosphocytidyl-2C-methyl-D-erythritol kinase [Sulfobacillus acidophilus]|uniref:4-diphosphocytidyl-2-C-methyl-D-erythritol kinase n=1 Tax=Sulfobacillus acidophilus TaxID=53633 RepID=A0A2T2WH83_9FIRM|nr:MAG: 4-diphosphocytidyl-2C-methyl-D-erythritol kinase [Sulfobacillus acidophilus]
MPWYQAPAKINLGLWVGARDASGYHPVDTVMQTVALSDQLYLEPRDYMLWESTQSSLPMDDQNLVVRAYGWAKQRKPDLPCVYGRLHKVTWIGAGLGGGSSDAAALIRWAFAGSEELRHPDFLGQSAQLGMDVPFFIVGGAARAQGYGERLETVPSLSAGGVVLANPGVVLSTAAVYRAFDEVGGHGRESDAIAAVVQALTDGQWPEEEDLHNDLESAAFRVMPSLRDFRDLMRSAADGAALALSGSGPTYYIFGRDEDWAQWMAQRLVLRGVPLVHATTVLESW